MKVPKVNCVYAAGYGFCKKKPRVFLRLFKAKCIEIELKKCDIAVRYPKPPLLPPPPPIARIREKEVS